MDLVIRLKFNKDLQCELVLVAVLCVYATLSKSRITDSMSLIFRLRCNKKIHPKSITKPVNSMLSGVM